MNLSVTERDPSEVGIDLAAVAEFVGQLGPLAVVDLETTGLPEDPTAEILEFGVVLLDPGRVATFQTLLQPAAPLPLLIQRLTGLSDADVASAPQLAESHADRYEPARRTSVLRLAGKSTPDRHPPP